MTAAEHDRICSATMRLAGSAHEWEGTLHTCKLPAVHVGPHDCPNCSLVWTPISRPLTDDGAVAVPARPSPAGTVPRPAPSSPRPFELVRHHDLNGQTGTGVVAEGVQFTDGTAALRWRGGHPATAVWPNVEEILAVHGHSGATELVWLDGGAIKARSDDARRREELWARYGVPTKVDPATALDALGLLGEVDPADVLACTYRDQEAADVYAAANLEHWGHPSLGTYETGDGVVGVLDLRAAIARLKNDTRTDADRQP